MAALDYKVLMIKLNSGCRFGVGKYVMRWVRSVMGVIERKEEGRELTAENLAKPQLPKNVEQQQKQMHQVQQQVSALQLHRLRNIDQTLGTRTHFHDTKFYEQRLDSSHIMQITRIKRRFLHSKQSLPDPQQPQPSLLRLTTKHSEEQELLKLRKYPSHPKTYLNLADGNDTLCIEFLAQEVLYTELSLRVVERVRESFYEDVIGEGNREEVIWSKGYEYFRRDREMAFCRVKKELIRKYEGKITSIPETETQYVLLLDQLYNLLLKHDKDPRVAHHLSKIQNQSLQYFFDRILWSQTERYIVVVLDIKNGKEFCVVVKDMVKDQLLPEVFLDVQEDVQVCKDCLVMVRRDEMGRYSEVVEWDFEKRELRMVYRGSPDKKLRLQGDPYGQFISLHESRITNPYQQSISIYFQPQSGFSQLFPQSQNHTIRLCYTPNGLIYSKFYKGQEDICIDEKQYAEEVFLVPFVGETKLTTVLEERGLERREEFEGIVREIGEVVGERVQVEGKEKGKQKQKRRLGAEHKSVFRCQEGSYIKTLTTLMTHTVILTNPKWTSTISPRGSTLTFLPHKPSATRSSLQFSQPLTLPTTQDFHSQNILLTLSNPLNTQYKYSIWKQTLQQTHPAATETQPISFPSSRDGSPIHATLYSDTKYKDQPLMAVIMVGQQQIQPEVIEGLLKKDVLFVVYEGRGSKRRNKEFYEEGAKGNIMNRVEDLLEVARYLVDKGLALDLAVYGKGHEGAYTVFMANVIQPELFSASCCYNGLYDLQDCIEYSQPSPQSPTIQQLPKQAPLNPLKMPYKSRHTKCRSIGRLSNILIISDDKNHFQSRKLIKKIRNGPQFQQEVYYYEGESDEDRELMAVCYLFQLMLVNSGGTRRR